MFFFSTDIIIVGGGDILNNYFIDKLREHFFKKPNKIIAFSVGLPYDDILISSNKLDIIDFIFIRTQQDMKLFSDFFTEDRLFYIPDISVYLPEIYGKTSMLFTKSIMQYCNSIFSHKLTKPKICEYNSYFVELQKCIISISKKKKIIGVMLNRHIYSKKELENYLKIVKGFSEIIIYMVRQNFHVVLLPFNTNNSKQAKENLQNDILIHTDICKIINFKDEKLLGNITNITEELTVEETYKLFDYFYASMPMRFHATLFSIYKFVPMIPVFTTKKIENFLKDIRWKYYNKLPTDADDIPLDIDCKDIIEKLKIIIKKDNNRKYKKYLYDQYCTFKNIIENEIQHFINTIVTPYEKKETIKYSNTHTVKILQLFQKLNSVALNNGALDFRCVTDDTQQNTLTEIACFYLTGNTDSCYFYGLKSKMFRDKNMSENKDISGNPMFDYEKEWKWILNDYYKKSEKKYNNVDGLFNLHFMNQKDESNVHRYGWKYVFESLKCYNNDNSLLYLDLYVDKTFHWKHNINRELGIIPYKTNWIGFIHHTFDTSFSNYNNTTLLENKEFIESLSHCQGLFVLSKYLQEQFIEEFKQRNIDVPIFYIIHPTEINVEKFSMKKFNKNMDKKLLHIGGWLRDIFSFYMLNIESNLSFNTNNCFYPFVSQKTDFIKKVAIRGKQMNNYFPTSNFSNEFHNFLLKLENKNNLKNDKILSYCSQNTTEKRDTHLTNNWNKHYYDYMVKFYNSVDIIEFIENNMYDTLLSENIVFLNLVDASAINTLIECIVRETPVVVNRHPAVIELLGENYPLYYSYSDNKEINYAEMNNEVNRLLFDPTKIARANTYLRKLDKNKFTIERFVENFLNIVNNL